MLKYIHDELTNSFYLVEDEGELACQIAEVLSALSEDELIELLGKDQLEKLREISAWRK